MPGDLSASKAFLGEPEDLQTSPKMQGGYLEGTVRTDQSARGSRHPEATPARRPPLGATPQAGRGTRPEHPRGPGHATRSRPGAGPTAAMAAPTGHPVLALPPRRAPAPTPTPHPRLAPSPSRQAPAGSREIRATERSGPFQIGIRYRFPGRRHCHARSLSARAAEAEVVAAGWRTLTRPRCPAPRGTTARWHSPPSRRGRRGEKRTRRRRRSSPLSTAAAPTALKCIVFSSGDRDAVGTGSRPGGGGGTAWASGGTALGRGARAEQVQPGCSQARASRSGRGERGAGAGGRVPFAAGGHGSAPPPRLPRESRPAKPGGRRGLLGNGPAFKGQ